MIVRIKSFRDLKSGGVINDARTVADDLVHAGERIWADQQLHWDRRCAAPPWPPRGIRRRGVVERSARDPWLHRRPRRPGGTCERRGRRGGCGRGRRAVLEGFHPRHRARIPQADDRAAGNLDQARLGGADRRSAVLPGPAGRDRSPDPPRRGRRGQRGLFPSADDRGCALRADRVVQPARDQGS